MNREKILQQGREGEESFQQWLQQNNLGFLRINQDWESMSPIFRESVKRPDFLLLLPSIGFIAIDVKNYSLSNGVFTLKIDDEIDRAVAFEHYTRIYLWYAFKDSNSDSRGRWYFISAHKACEVGELKHNAIDNVSFFRIKIDEFEIIENANDLKKLFNSRIGLLGRFTRAIEYGFKSMSNRE